MNTAEYISDKVVKIVKKHKTRDPFELCEAMGIRVKYIGLSGRLGGYFFCQSRIKTIVLDTALSEAAAKTLCAHELGHACLHSDTLTAMRLIGDKGLFNSKDITEYEADIFAAELLIPDGVIKELVADEETGASVYSFAKHLCVPPELVDFKLRSMQERGYGIAAPYTASSDFLKNGIDGIYAE